MGIKFEEWVKRISNRSDLTGRLTHLTKPIGIDTIGMNFEDINIKAVDNLINILKEKKINGSTTIPGYIVGDKKAVCFLEAPLYALVQNVEYEHQRREANSKEKLRYCGVGLSFLKPNIYLTYHGRPVIYEKTEVAKKFLPAEEWWRIVALEYVKDNNYSWDIVDWTHEREWRVPGDMEFDFDNDWVHIVLYNPSCVNYFLERSPKEIVSKICGITTLTSVLM